MLVFDVSSSMSATDVPPSRVVAAQQAADTFIDQVDDTVEVGLITFSAVVSLDARPTLDRTAVADAVGAIQLSDGTAIGDALSAATRLLVDMAGDNGPPTTDGTGATTGDVPGAIVLLSDGETTVGRPTADGAQEVAAAGIPVFTIAFGTPEGTITDPVTGETIPTPVQPEALAEVASDHRRPGVRGRHRSRADRRLPAHPGLARRHARRACRARQSRTRGSGPPAPPPCSPPPGHCRCGGSAGWSDGRSPIWARTFPHPDLGVLTPGSGLVRAQIPRRRAPSAEAVQAERSAESTPAANPSRSATVGSCSHTSNPAS